MQRAWVPNNKPQWNFHFLVLSRKSSFCGLQPQLTGTCAHFPFLMTSLRHSRLHTCITLCDWLRNSTPTTHVLHGEVRATGDPNTKSSQHTGLTGGEHRGSRHHLICAPSPLLTFRKRRSWHLSHHFMANRWGNNGNSDRLYFLGHQNQCRWSLQP